MATVGFFGFFFFNQKNGFIWESISIWDKQAIEKAIGKSIKEELYFIEKRRKLEKLVLNKSLGGKQEF